MVTLHGIAEEDGACYLVMEWARLGPLDQYLTEHRYLTERERERRGEREREGGRRDQDLTEHTTWSLVIRLREKQRGGRERERASERE